VDGQLPGGQDLKLDLSNDSVGLIGISSSVQGRVRARLEQLALELRARDQQRDLSARG
jgi:hypothetical protein